MEELFYCLFVLHSGLPGIRQLGWNAENIFRRNRQFREQSLIRHAVVAVRAIRRDMTLVAPEEKHFAPVQSRSKVCGQFLMEATRRRSTRQNDSEVTVSFYGV